MSKLALQLIAENKRTKNPSLDLGNCGLREIPKELFDCVWLEKLILSNEWWDEQKDQKIESKNKGAKNYISEIPSEITALQKLKTLKAGGKYENKWGILNYSYLQSLTSLESLYLRSNQISDISFLQSLTGLKSLYLSSNQILDISFLQSLTGLESFLPSLVFPLPL